MVTSLLLALIVHAPVTAMAPISGNMEWEELPLDQKTPDYHPRLIFDPPLSILGFSPRSSFMFASPDYVAEGHYQVTDGYYSFHPDTAMQIGNREVNELVADLDPETRNELHKAYARSLNSFEAEYYPATKTLSLTCLVKGKPKTFALHAYTEGDDQLSSSLSDADRGFAGLWHAPEPFPEKLDCQTRYKIGGLEGLQQFTKEAEASEAAQFGLLDLRVDYTFRIHGGVGNWSRNGSILKLGGTELMISKDGGKLLSHGKVLFTRN